MELEELLQLSPADPVCEHVQSPCQMLSSDLDVTSKGDDNYFSKQVHQERVLSGFPIQYIYYTFIITEKCDVGVMHLVFEKTKENPYRIEF